MKAFYINDLSLIRRLDDIGGALFEVSEPYEVLVQTRPGDLSSVRIASGVHTNFASVPWFARWLISPLTGIEAATVHDVLYSQRDFWVIGTCTTDKLPDRATCDRIFWALLVEAERMRPPRWDNPIAQFLGGLWPRWRPFAMWSAVRLCGWYAWRKAEQVENQNDECSSQME